MKALLLLAVMLLAVHPTTGSASDQDIDQIERLLLLVGKSDCVFIRNGKEYSSADAEKHLRLKYKRGKRWVKDVDTFIDRLATKSSMSGKPYMIRCGEDEPLPSADWMRALLLQATEELQSPQYADEKWTEPNSPIGAFHDRNFVPNWRRS